MADFLHSSKGSHFKKKKYTKFTASYEVYRLLKSLFIVNIIVKILLVINVLKSHVKAKKGMAMPQAYKLISNE
jgi:hypothetical protein